MRREFVVGEEIVGTPMPNALGLVDVGNSETHFIIPKGQSPRLQPRIFIPMTRVPMDGSSAKNVIAANTAYADALLPSGMHVAYLPCSAAAASELASARDVREYLGLSPDEKAVLLLTGGEHIGPDFNSRNHVAPSPSADRYGRHTPERDAIESALLRGVLNDRNICIVGICRGHQGVMCALTGKPPSDIENGSLHGPVGDEPRSAKSHQVQNAGTIYTGLPDVIESNSFHAQGFYAGDMTTGSGEWGPWLVSQDGVLEATVRRDSRNRVTSITMQGHPEREDGWNEPRQRQTICTFVQDSIVRFFNN
jgi:gamma-glutamyl-gamma-aminobutyrate hydrolase PuuD